jgi:hypothetical protein
MLYALYAVYVVYVLYVAKGFLRRTDMYLRRTIVPTR